MYFQILFLLAISCRHEKITLAPMPKPTKQTGLFPCVGECNRIDFLTLEKKFKTIQTYFFKKLRYWKKNLKISNLL